MGKYGTDWQAWVGLQVQVCVCECVRTSTHGNSSQAHIGHGIHLVPDVRSSWKQRQRHATHQ